jgi:hypothetical protein
VIDTLRDITLVGRHTRKSTTFEVSAEGRSAPLARLHKDHCFTSKHALSVFTGPELDQLEGWVTPRWAAGPDRTRIGTVDHNDRVRLFGQETWTFEQDGLPVLTGRLTGATKVRYGGPLVLIPMVQAMDMLFTYHVRFRADGSEGFDFARLAGASHPRYSLRIHDDRISTMLALAVVCYYDRVLDDDPRKRLLKAERHLFLKD